MRQSRNSSVPPIAIASTFKRWGVLYRWVAIFMASIILLMLALLGLLYPRRNNHLDASAATFDTRGHLWLTGLAGAGEWDPDTQTLTRHLPDKQIITMATGAKGVIWLGTWQGLYRYDGAVWTEQNQGLTSAIAIAPDESIWIGTYADVEHFDGRSWKSYTAQDGLVLAPDMFIGAIVVMPNGTAWFSTNQGRVSSFDGTVWQSWPAYSPPMTVAADGAVWLTRRAGGVARYDGETWTTYPDYRFPVVKSSDGAIWLVRAAGGVARYDGRDWPPYTQADGLASDKVADMMTAPDGSLWVYDGAEGLSHFDGGTWTVYQFAQLGRPQQTLDIYQDGSAYSWLSFVQIGPDGKLWRASQNGRELRLARYALPE